jgi:hypothetical protein
MRYELQFQSTRAETGFIQLPLPQGPFIQLHQHDLRVIPCEDIIVGRDWEEVKHLINQNEFISEFDLTWGYVTLGCVKGKCQIIGAHYDTSD